MDCFVAEPVIGLHGIRAPLASRMTSMEQIKWKSETQRRGDRRRDYIGARSRKNSPPRDSPCSQPARRRKLEPLVQRSRRRRDDCRAHARRAKEEEVTAFLNTPTSMRPGSVHLQFGANVNFPIWRPPTAIPQGVGDGVLAGFWPVASRRG